MNNKPTEDSIIAEDCLILALQAVNCDSWWEHQHKKKIEFAKLQEELCKLYLERMGIYPNYDE